MMPPGNGLSIDVMGTPVFWTIVVVDEKPVGRLAPPLVGAQNKPYPPRSTVLSFNLKTTPPLGDA